MSAILTLRGITARRGGHNILRGIDLDIAPAETLGLIGASGAGKSTLARIVLGLDRPDGGQRHLAAAGVQAVFQDPQGSLDPTHSIARIVAEPLATRRVRRPERARRTLAALEAVGLQAALATQRPGSLSGGQRQRVAIARALIADPALLVADEPVSALDVSVQAQVLNLLRDARRERGLSMLFISHDLAATRHLCQRVAVLHDGRIVECAPAETLFATPRHDATKALLTGRPLPADAALGR